MTPMQTAITPEPLERAIARARVTIANAVHPNVTFSLHVTTIAGLLAGLDEINALRVERDELRSRLKCRCGPEGCADSTCPGKCGVAA